MDKKVSGGTSGSDRIEYDGAFYHVMARGNRRERIFRDEADRLLFYETLGEAGARVELMSNHYHLMEKRPKPTWWRECDGCRTPVPGGIRFVD
jgi:hypothetical protein